MARRTIEIKIEDRENTFDFVIEEMSATKLESWIVRALLLLAASGHDGVPAGADIQKAGKLLAEKGLSLLGTLDYAQAQPLLDEMLGCCYRKIGGLKERCTPEVVDGYVEDVTTLVKLRMEAAKLNLGFLLAEDGPLSDFRRSPNTGPK
ncbi:MAG: hypothetical protein LBV79_10315 [Candidatus Adiutrix sp.]|jgi:hypothetical protein|nr:hypothetical protein [Candidatus Adiutrix sp.]